MKNKLSVFWNKLRYKNITLNLSTGTKTIVKKRSLTPIICLMVLALFLICFIFIEIPNNIRFDQFPKILQQMFEPSKWSLKTWDGYWSYLSNTAIPKIWSTVEMVSIATFIGTIISIPFFILASSNIFTSKWVYGPIRVIINIIRTIPTFVLAVFATVFFGFNETSGVVAMAVFTGGVLFKLMYEYIETCDMNPREASRSSGSNTLQAFDISIVPQIKPTFISNIIYVFEINIRASVVLGFVGAGGIGQLLSDAIESTSYDKVGAILIPLFILVVVLQFISSEMRRRIQ